MPYSYIKFKKEVKDAILEKIHPNSNILDVGAGSGTYGEMLKGKFQSITGLEIFPNYLEMFQLHGKYDNMIIGSILNYNFGSYDFIIMGDVLEHLSVEDAQRIIKKVELNNQSVLVAVPYNFVQGMEYGNIHETHLQPDLTPEIMDERYPSLTLLYGDSNYGYYVNDKFNQGYNQ